MSTVMTMPATMPVSEIMTAIAALAAEAGAGRWGVARADDVEPQEWERFERWLASGGHASMGYMERWGDIRRNPLRLLDEPSGAQGAGEAAAGSRAQGSVISLAFSYYHEERQLPSAARIAMYAHGDDYHEVLRRRLEPLAAWLRSLGYRARICVDSAPILERYWAVKAGVGFVGRNRLLIVPGMGSYLFLAEVVTDAVLPESEPLALTCGDCMRCVRACPGGALRCEGFDSAKCLSYLTIEHRGDLPAAVDSRPLAQAMGRKVYGCDACQMVCPHNAGLAPTPIAEFHLRPALRTLTHADILALTPEAYSAIFAHSAAKRLRLAGLRRNAGAGKGN